MKGIGSYPGAPLFRFISALILIMLLAIFFLDKIDQFENDVERTQVAKGITEINSMLSLVFLEYAIENTQNELASFQGGNPFLLLKDKYTSLSYSGPINTSENSEVPAGAWYFDELNGMIIYRSRYSEITYRYRLNFSYYDNNKSGRFEAGTDEAKTIRMKKYSN